MHSRSTGETTDDFRNAEVTESDFSSSNTGNTTASFRRRLIEDSFSGNHYISIYN